ncbi:uncharacterized protein LOC129600540 [Paramacrobiotus metropolitanus]|uniref:uncharacterized protein LOC129600540 n=1 Tax=Paramacrobiotus metropolitanus TaxID=2943436 RepID=UPI002445A0F0|nr:uncharacterized protein LOC129600540 [Paramacrobiotus metropolitanus]
MIFSFTPLSILIVMVCIDPVLNQLERKPGHRAVNVSLLVAGIATGGYGSLPYTAPALSLAVDHVHKIYNGSIRFNTEYVQDQNCGNLTSNVAAVSADIYYRQRKERDALVSILPGCEIGGAVELARLCTQWDALWISMAGASPITGSQRLQYPTGIITSYFRMSDAGELFIQLLLKFNWTSVNVIIDNSSPAFYADVGALVVIHLKNERRIRFTVWTLSAQSTSPFADFPSILEKIRATSRVVLYFGNGPALREFLFIASSMEMTNGEHVSKIECLQGFNWIMVPPP